MAHALVEAHLEEARAGSDWLRIQNESRARTDESGQFAIERVTPGEARVHWQADSVEQSRPPDRYYLAPFVAVEPGKTAHVELVLEGGLPLVGRVAVAADGGPSLEDVKWDAFLAPKLPEPPFPADLPRKDRDSWLNRWSLSEAGKEYRRLQRNFGHTLRLKPDRSFRVDEIQPGRYRLDARVRGIPPGLKDGYERELARLTRDFTVPAPAPGAKVEPVDLGTLSLERLALLRPGDPAPGFEVPTVDGKSLKLTDFRGRFVLLDFWATWCGPCREETPHLKAVHEAFGRDDRLVMIGLSLDEEAKAPARYAADHGMTWHQGFLGDWQEAKLPGAFGVQGIPSIMLIGPDGKVIATDLRGAQIKEAVGDALAR